MRWWLSQTLVKWFKQLGYLGWVRFRILRFAYKIFWTNSPRNGEWDFILSWLRPLREWQKPVSVLDVGSTESLLIYELLHRGYSVTGIDQRPYQEKNPHTKVYDILEGSAKPPEKYLGMFDYIIAVSTVEHIGLNSYGENYENNNGDRFAVSYLAQCLKDDGFFFMTVPNKHLGTDTGRGYSFQAFKKLIKNLFRIIYYEERSNQICAVMVKYQS